MLAAGVILAASAITRTLLKNPEVSFNRKGNPEPWNAYRDKQYKVFSNMTHKQFLHLTSIRLVECLLGADFNHLWFQFFGIGRDYSQVHSEAPDYRKIE